MVMESIRRPDSAHTDVSVAPATIICYYVYLRMTVAVAVL